MQGFLGRNAVTVGAAAATVLLIMQLRRDGVTGYEPADVLSILLIAVPIATHGLRAPKQRRPRARRPADTDTSDETPTEQSRQRPQIGRIDPQTARSIERLLVRGAGMFLAVGAWVLAVVLVLMQAWSATVSALIVFGIATFGIPRGSVERPVSAPLPDDG